MMTANASHSGPRKAPGAQQAVKGNTEVSKEAVRALAAHKALLLLMAGAKDARTLARLAIPMTETEFLSLCEERALAGRCGNPLCSNEHTYKAPSSTPKIDWSTLAMINVTVEQNWCSKDCHAKCAQFAKSLGNAVDRLEVLNRLQSGSTAASTKATAPVVSHVRGGQKAAAAPPTNSNKILSDVRERTPSSVQSTRITPPARVQHAAGASQAQAVAETLPSVSEHTEDASNSHAQEKVSANNNSCAPSGGANDTTDRTTDAAAAAARSGVTDTDPTEPATNAAEADTTTRAAAGSGATDIDTTTQVVDASWATTEAAAAAGDPIAANRAADACASIRRSCDIDDATPNATPPTSTAQCPSGAERATHADHASATPATADPADHALAAQAPEAGAAEVEVEGEHNHVEHASAAAASEATQAAEGAVVAEPPPQARPRLRQRRVRFASPPEEVLGGGAAADEEGGTQEGDRDSTTVGEEQMRDLRRQSMTDMLRFYLAPEVGGAGVAVESKQLHDIAGLLKASKSKNRANKDGSCNSDEGKDKDNADIEEEDVESHYSSVSDDDEEEDDFIDDDVYEDDFFYDDELDADDKEETDVDSTSTRAVRFAQHAKHTQVEEIHDEGQDTEQNEERDEPQSVEGFFDATTVSKPRLSLFGVAWRLLNSWICPETVLHMHGRHACGSGTSFSQTTLQSQSALIRVLLPRLEPIRTRLHIQLSPSLVEDTLCDSVRTLDIRTAVPTMPVELQDCLVVVLLAAASKHCVCELSPSFDVCSSAGVAGVAHGAGSRLFKGLLEDLGLTEELFQCLLGCLLDPVQVNES